MEDDQPVSKDSGICEEKKVRVSIRDLAPLEFGGTDARCGFDLQDHVAAGFCIQMLADPALKEVWCENQDDVTLIWDDVSGEQVEFVQVKNTQIDGLWSVPKLCERQTAQSHSSEQAAKSQSKKAKKIGSSILERSLAYDRCPEACRFRIVTSWQINGELRILSLSREYREGSLAEMASLVRSLRRYVSDFVSENGHDCEFWATNTQWEVVGSTELLRSKNVLAFSKYVVSLGEFLVPDQIEEVYMSLVAKVAEASRIKWELDRSKKRLVRGDLISWVVNIIHKMLRPASKGSTKLRTKMKNAMLPHDSIESAVEERSRYREEMLAQRYFTSIEYRSIEGEIVSILHSLRSNLDSGVFDDLGIAFHGRCRAALDSFRESIPTHKRPHAAFVHGCMYDITDRCTHRFTRPTT